jgi:hypothetical protein
MKRYFAVFIFSVCAVPLFAQQAPNPEVFNVEDYLNIYSDLTTSTQAAVTHWTTYGLPKEGRRASIIFDPDYYLQNNPDLSLAFGRHNYKAALQHFLTQGLPIEGRRGSLEFDVQYYLKNNSDLMKQYGPKNYRAAADHFLTQGFPVEGHAGSADFDVKAYINLYPDVRAAYGSTGYQQAMWQWLRRGKAQGRSGAGSPEISPDCQSAAPPKDFSRVFIALRKDGERGSGTAGDPFDGSTAERFDTLLRTRSEAKEHNLIVCLGQGTFHTDGAPEFGDHATRHGFTINKNWKIHGAGMGRTTVQLVEFRPAAFNLPKGTGAGVVFSTYDDLSSGVEISDLTIDDNYAELKPRATSQGITALNLDAIRLRSNDGGHWIHRVNVVHSSGEITETFPIMVFSIHSAPLSENNLIEYVTMSEWGGGECTAIALANTTGEVRNNVVKDYQIAYGGWAMGRVVFHDNFAINNAGYGFNVDSLANRNVVIEFNQIIHPQHYGIVIGGGGRYSNFQLQNNTIRVNTDTAVGLVFQGNVTGASVGRNNFITEQRNPQNVTAMLIKGTGNQDNLYSSNRVLVNDRWLDVRPNLAYAVLQDLRIKKIQIPVLP